MIARPGGLIAAALALLAAATAVAAPSPASGPERFEVILWRSAAAGAARLAGARRLGVTAGMLLGRRDDPPPAELAADLASRAAPLRAAGLAYDVENIATDFYAPYHRWQPDRTVTWAFDLLQARHQADRADPQLFWRAPSLSDPRWQARIAARLAAHVQATAAAPPLFYALGDETGIADLASAWDFDRSPPALAEFRGWLRGQYGSLAALNAEWGTGFADWEAVLPLRTDAALALTDGNFAAWADFADWMDAAFAAAIRAGTAALHRAAPAARAALEGAQQPGTGGYDYVRLAGAVDVMEVSADPPTAALAQALNPALRLLSTVGSGDPAARHRLWRALLDGSRGLVLWDPDDRFVRADGTPGPAGRALAPLLAALRGPLGAALLAARPQPGPVGILYSPASLRTGWLLDRQAAASRGADWSQRRAADELADNPGFAALRQAADTLAHLGFEPRWLTPASLAAGALRQGVRVLLLPQAWALSDAERLALAGFVAGGGRLLADRPPGGYDAHSRRVAAAAVPATPLADFSAALLGPALAAAGLDAGIVLTHPDGTGVTDVRVRVLRQGNATLLALQRDFSADGGMEEIVLTLPRAYRIAELRFGLVRLTEHMTLRLDAVAPVLLRVAGW